ncbi:S1 family peptidase [Streptomyces hygroscopicus]|uniref:S1 family peptidase n=1 Tax=Streptomyces hygroscopicus TaxID=1912 RepID=UPI0033C8C916
MRGSKKVRKTRLWAGGVALLGTAALTVPAAGAATAPVNDAREARASVEVSTESVDALVARTGIDADRAERYLAAQPQLVERGQALVSRLGDRSAGFYLDAPVEQPVVTVLDSAAAETVRATGARAKMVRHTTAELRRAEEALGEAVPVPDTSWYIDTAANQVVLTIGPGAQGNPGLGALQATATGLGDRVRVEHAARDMRPTAMLMGDEIRIADPGSTTGNVCSVGFNVHSLNDTKYIVTAGHCVKPNKKYYDSSGNQLGDVAESNYGGLDQTDWAVIRTNSSESWFSMVNGYGQPAQVIHDVGDRVNLAQGAQVCKSGRTTKVTCGSVVSNDSAVNYDDGTQLRHQILTKVTTEGGDSGGPLYMNGTGYGIIHGGAAFSDGSSGSYSQPVKQIFDEQGLVLNP